MPAKSRVWPGQVPAPGKTGQSGKEAGSEVKGKKETKNIDGK